jgi:hypothetical protein
MEELPPSQRKDKNVASLFCFVGERQKGSLRGSLEELP